MATKFNNIPGQDAPKKKTSNTVTPDAPSGRISKSKSSEPVKKTSNTVTPDAPSKNAPREKSIPLPIRMKNIVTPEESSPAASKVSTPVVTKKSAPVVTKTMSKPVVKSSPISSSYGSDEDAARQSSIDENREFFRSRGAFKSGGAVKASRGDGIAQRGKTRGRIC